jgi:rod shape-determining protein MreC
MKRFFQSYENILLLLALLVLASIIMSSNIKERGPSNALERTALAVATPLQKRVTSAIRGSILAWEQYIDLTNTAVENKKLTKMLDEERFKNNLLYEELKKFRRVKKLRSNHPVSGAKVVVADVVGWDSTNVSQTLIINRGTDNGVREGMVVMNNQGLIGRIVEASGNSSRVLMITDSRSAVDAYLQESRDRCIIVGQNKRWCMVRFLPLDAKVKEGDMIISSGLGGVYPKGLPLGTISKLEKGSGRLFYKARAATAAELKQLEEVLVITSLEHDKKKPDSKKKPNRKKGRKR